MLYTFISFKAVLKFLVALSIINIYECSILPREVQKTVDFNNENSCYESLSEEKFYFAITKNSVFSNLPRYIVVNAVSKWSKYGDTFYFDSTTYYLQLSSSKCSSTFEFSTPTNFTSMNLRLNFKTGYSSNPFTVINLDMYPGVDDNLFYLTDMYGILGLYASYKHGDDKVLKHSAELSYDEFTSKMNPESFNKKFICVTDRQQMYVLKSNTESLTKQISPYQSIILRYFMHGSPASLSEVSAWPCDSDPTDLHKKIKFGIVLYPSTGNVHIEFSNMTEYFEFNYDMYYSILKRDENLIISEVPITSLTDNSVAQLDSHIIVPFDKVTEEYTCPKFPNVKFKTLYSVTTPVLTYKETFDGTPTGFKNYRYEVLQEIDPCS